MRIAFRFIVLVAFFIGTLPTPAQDAPRPSSDAIVALTVVVRRDTVPLADVLVRSGEDTLISIRMTAHTVELSAVTVSATRSGRRIEDEPLRVEVLSQEEVEEKLLMTPGDITMMLNESSGLRVQTTSPSVGGAAVRVQGLRGRYTQILADGLPLYGGQTGGLGLLQIPPMDLGGVEIIKGVASALYGGSALGGVINLISRRPRDEPARELLLDQTTLGGTNAVGFASRQITGRWGYTVLAGAHRQSSIDRDDDGWIDLPGYERLVLRPRAFWSSAVGHSVMATLGTTLEGREGGTMDGATVPDGTAFPENLRTNRHDAGVVGGFLLGPATILSVRGAAAMQRHRHTFGDARELDRHLTWLGEASVTTERGISLWIIGAALQQERYDADDVRGFDYRYTTPGVFAQNTLTLSQFLSVTASARVDRHSEYGPQIAPRLSALLRLAPAWSLRASAGGGYFAPSPFTEETEVTGLTIDLGGTLGVIELNVTAFASMIEDPVGVRGLAATPGRVELVNIGEPTETGIRRDAPLTPRHQAGVVTMWEQEEQARAGLEVYFTGRKPLDDNPYRTVSKPYVHVGVLAERRFGRARAFVNAENLLGYRQTQYDPLVLPSRGLGGRWTTEV